LSIVLSFLHLLTIVLSVLLLSIVLSVLHLLSIVLSIPLWFTDYGYTFGIFKLFLNSDDQQFTYFLQSEKSLRTWIERAKKRPWHMPMEIHDLALDRHKHVAELHRLMFLFSKPHDL
jgi:hypothetical protein